MLIPSHVMPQPRSMAALPGWERQGQESFWLSMMLAVVLFGCTQDGGSHPVLGKEMRGDTTVFITTSRGAWHSAALREETRLSDRQGGHRESSEPFL